MASLEPNVRAERCVSLRWKGLHVYGEHDAALQQPQQGEPACWCVKTQYCLGPDGKVADRNECSPRRSCYKPL